MGLSCEGRSQTHGDLGSAPLAVLMLLPRSSHVLQEEFHWTKPRCSHSLSCWVGALLFQGTFCFLLDLSKSTKMLCHKKCEQVKCFYLHMVFLQHFKMFLALHAVASRKRRGGGGWIASRWKGGFCYCRRGKEQNGCLKEV